MSSTAFHQHLERLRTQGQDDDQVEVKALAGHLGKKNPEIKSLWESVSAFANTKGGLLFLGLSEDNGFTPAPGFDAQDVIARIHQGLNATDSTGAKVEPVPNYSVQTECIGSAPVVILRIEPLCVNGPCHVRERGIKNGSFKRVAEDDQTLSPLEIYQLQHRFDQLTIDAHPVPDSTINDLDANLLTAVEKHLRATGSRALSGKEIQWLRHMKITTSNEELTMAGLLCLGTYPQEFFPSLLIDVAVHPGKTKSHTSHTRFLDRKVCDGSIPAMLLDCLRAIKNNLRVRRVVSGSQGRDLLEIPEDVLREAIANAVMHRDYSEQALAQKIHVDIYSDRVEIINPGGFPGAKNPKDLLNGIPATRNRIVARLLAEIPTPAESDGVLAESNGSGIPRMFAAMREAGLPVPEYEVDIAQVKVTLRRFGLMEPSVTEWLSGLLGHDDRPTDGIALVLARELGAVSINDMRNQTGHDSDDLRQAPQGLRDRGLLAEVRPDHFRIPTPGDRLSEAEQDILSALSTTTPRSSRNIAEATGRSLASLRPLLRRLVDSGLIRATAPTSRNRAYLLAEG
ncbi:putative DNA binding domain-containing protein [Corynebacterium sp. zg-331]|uniref:ATP-binding protein n=1 Tax=unclassified Corynebacterium TaxID=2624378 RepID=UPI00128E650A|nr:MULTISPECIES: ATP-binding protein [unclassified Corynebacterium]MBC3185732.1 putative DNA binding domain-containing protein [Corynebacterium sp. zg-331]MPV52225.1 ATPase [Corynebacterium sp. zg331]